MKRIYRFLALAIISLATANISSAQVNIGGQTMNNDIIGWGDLYNLSFTAHNYGTARSMAMGNAFAALGADMVSASLNPAGIGMYVSGDFSFTPMIEFAKSPTRSSAEGFDLSKFSSSEYKDRTTRFGFASIGGVGSVYRGTGFLTNINMGFAYNRIADFNQDIKFASFYNHAGNSMANFLCTLSNAENLQTDSDGRMPFGNDPYIWGAVLGYKNGLTNKDAEGWYIDRIAEHAEVDQFSAIKSRGSIGEFALSFGFNFVDKLYVGATLGMQSVDYRREVFYGEDYIYPNESYPSGEEMPYQLEYMNYRQYTEVSGAGINLKLGITWRPVHWLRMGFAYHTPTAYNLSIRYNADMWSATYNAGNNPDGYAVENNRIYDYVESPMWEDRDQNAWRVSSPSRLMVGAAVTIARRLILSADYEASYYAKTRLRSAPIWGLDYDQTFEDNFRRSNTLRLGAEFRLLPAMDLRLGYITSGGAVKHPELIYSHPIVKSEEYITAGIGFKLSNTVSFDLAYQYNTRRYSAYQMFYAVDTENEVYVESVPVTSDMRRHIAVATLSVRF